MIQRRTHYMSETNRIGVFLCHCGGNISDNVDLDKIEEKLSEKSENFVIIMME